MPVAEIVPNLAQVIPNYYIMWQWPLKQTRSSMVQEACSSLGNVLFLAAATELETLIIK